LNVSRGAVLYLHVDDSNNNIMEIYSSVNNIITVKHAHAVTSIKRWPVLKSHLLLVLSENFIYINFF